MTPESGEQSSGYGKAAIWKLAGLAAVLGVGTYLASPYLLPGKLPAGCPELPDLKTVNQQVADVLKKADREARRHPESAAAVGHLGIAYHGNLMLDRAARAYQAAARLAPKDAQWVYAQAFVAEENGDQTGQARLLEETLTLNPNHVASLVKLGDFYFKTEQFEQAGRYYQKALEAAGSNVPQASMGLARIAERAKDWAKAAAFAESVTRLRPDLTPPFLLLEKAYQAMGDQAKLAAAQAGAGASSISVPEPFEDGFNQQLNDVCYTSTRLLKQASLSNQLGRPERALELARRAREAEPKDADVPLLLARTLLAYYPTQPARVDEAMEQLGQGLRLRPEDPAPLWTFAQDFLSQPKSPEAVEKLAALMQPYAKRDDAHLYLGMLAAARGNYGLAITEYQAALKDDFSNSGVLNNIGVAMEKAGRPAEALAYYEKAVKLNPENPTARFTLAMAELQRGNQAAGLNELGEAVRIKQDYSDAYFAMGFALLDAKKLNDAAKRFQQGLRYAPGAADGHFGLGAALAMGGRRDDAMAELRAALRLNPGHAEAQQMLQQLSARAPK